MSAGIASQYGFLYQRYVFIMTVLKKVGVDKFFIYEGKDDIDVSEEKRIIAMGTSDDSFIQVKSGIVTKDCWAKVLGNWLLVDDGKANYELVLENNLSFDVESDDTIDYVCSYFIEGKNKKTTAIANQVYMKFVDEVGSLDEILKAHFSSLLVRVKRTVISFDKVMAEIESTFKSVYCQDIEKFDMAKKCRAERFIEYIQKEIDSSLKEKKKCIFRYQDFVRIINKVIVEISDNKYIVDTADMKKKKKVQAEKLLTDDRIREIKQLKMVSDRNGFVVDELIKELLYKDFRDVYLESTSTVIANMEDVAYTNFKSARYSLPENVTAKQLFDETVKREIPSPIINNSPIYRNGCYIFLTGDDIDEEKQITWGYENA